MTTQDTITRAKNASDYKTASSAYGSAMMEIYSLAEAISKTDFVKCIDCREANWGNAGDAHGALKIMREAAWMLGVKGYENEC